MSVLFEEMEIGSLRAKNRLVRAATYEALADDGGHMTPELTAIYEELADGGVGTIIVGYARVMRNEQPNPRMLGIYDDSFVPEFRALTDMAHAHGTAIVSQIVYGGSATKLQPPSRRILGPSAVANPKTGIVPVEATVADLHELAQAFADAAARAQTAGFDGVELHAAHGYLLNQFFSPLTNRRADRYAGGTLEGRTRLHCEILCAVRAAVGAEYPVAVRFGACDYMAGGSTEADAAEAAALLEAAGADLLDISGGLCGYRNPQSRAPGYFGAAAEAVRQRVSVPVLLTGGVIAADEAEALLERGCADLIGVGRALLKDAGWARSALGGER